MPGLLFFVRRSRSIALENVFRQAFPRIQQSFPVLRDPLACAPPQRWEEGVGHAARTYEGIFDIDVEITPHTIDIDCVKGPEDGRSSYSLLERWAELLSTAYPEKLTLSQQHEKTWVLMVS